MSKMIIPITYKLSKHGVLRSDGAGIPNSDDNRDWRKYQEWLALGHIPEPEFTPEEEATKALDDERQQVQEHLNREKFIMVKFMMEMFQTLKEKGLVTEDDIHSTVLEKAREQLRKLKRLDELKGD